MVLRLLLKGHHFADKQDQHQFAMNWTIGNTLKYDFSENVQDVGHFFVFTFWNKCVGLKELNTALWLGFHNSLGIMNLNKYINLRLKNWKKKVFW